MKRLTDAQKDAIRRLRTSGLGYKTIANMLSISRDTVRSFCLRNSLSVGTDEPDVFSDDLGTNGNLSAEMQIGSTIFVITTAYSENATEPLEKKLEKLILDAVMRQSRCYQFVRESA